MIIRLFINAIAFYVAAYLIPGFFISGFAPLVVAAVVWGLLTLILKPILVILTLPINILSLGLFTFVINALLLLLLAKIVPGFTIANFSTALLASIVLSLVNLLLSKQK